MCIQAHDGVDRAAAGTTGADLLLRRLAALGLSPVRLPRPNLKSFTISRDDAPAASITIDARSMSLVRRLIAPG